MALICNQGLQYQIPRLVFIMSKTSNNSRDEYTFKKFQCSHNYKQWTQNMSFALQEARLWRKVEGMAIAPTLLEVKRDDGKNWMEKIYAQEEKII